MKVKREIDWHIRVGDWLIRGEEEIQLDLSGEDAYLAIFEWDGEGGIKAVFNSFAKFVTALMDEQLSSFSPELKETVRKYLLMAARRFQD